MNTLESGINVAPGKFSKKNKRSPIYTLCLYHLNRLYEVRNKTVAPEKSQKINKRFFNMFNPDTIFNCRYFSVLTQLIKVLFDENLQSGMFLKCLQRIKRITNVMPN